MSAFYLFIIYMLLLRKEETMKANKKAVLAYSGGLDTSIILKWLSEALHYQVIAVCVDVGQKEDFKALEKKALNTGAASVMVIDAKDSFIEDYVFKGLKAGAVYEDDYLLGTAYARPLIAKILVNIAKAENASAIAHGATGKGNDQVRFEASIKALYPEVDIIAPWRIWDLNSRDALLNYAHKHNIPVPVSKENNYSRDDNLWHISHEGHDLESPQNAHDPAIYWKCQPIGAYSNAEKVSIDFEQGIPVAIDGVKMPAVEIVSTLNDLAGKCGVGVVDIVENRLVGMKSRGVYETPGGTVLYHAHKVLEKLTLDKATMHYKQKIALEYADLLYNGLWYSPLKTALDAFVDETQKYVSGTVNLQLQSGTTRTLSATSPYSLYDEELVTFNEDNVYDQGDATGFINLFSLSLKYYGKKHNLFEDNKMISTTHTKVV